MIVPLSDIIEEADEFITKVLKSEKFGDVIIRITLDEGVPVKLEKAFCEHLTRRKTASLVVNKESGKTRRF